MTANRRTAFAVTFAVLLTLSMGVLGFHGAAQTQTVETRTAGVQDSTELELTASGSNVIVPGGNVTANFTLTNAGDQASTAAAIELVSVPGEWEVVDQSAAEGMTYSEANAGWVLGEPLAPGESVSATVTFRLSNDSATTAYYVSARATDAAGAESTAVETFPVGRPDGTLGLETSVPDAVAPGENVTMDVTLRNDGENQSTAPAVSLVLPRGWSVVNQSASEGVTYSEANTGWVATEGLASGESTTVSAVVRPSNDATAGQHHLSVRASDADNRSAVTAARVNVTDAGDGAADAEPTQADEGEPTQTVAETTEVDEAETTRADEGGNVSATFSEDGEPLANVTLEVADEPDERMQGLMHRESLPENHGMVFVYEEAEPRSFWMKNTLIPLDMIFVDENGTVVNVEHADPPEPDVPDEELERYQSDGPAKYVIELEQGFANETGVGPGTQVEFDVEGTLEPGVANATDS